MRALDSVEVGRVVGDHADDVVAHLFDPERLPCSGAPAEQTIGEGFVDDGDARDGCVGCGENAPAPYAHTERREKSGPDIALTRAYAIRAACIGRHRRLSA